MVQFKSATLIFRTIVHSFGSQESRNIDKVGKARSHFLWRSLIIVWLLMEFQMDEKETTPIFN